jgi:tight adherence protein B
MREALLKNPQLRDLRSVAYATASLLFALSLTKSLPISTALAVLTLSMHYVGTRRREARNSQALMSAMPEIIDHIISGIQSGLSLNESLTSLSARGPLISQAMFKEHGIRMGGGTKFEESVAILQDEFSLRSADQLFESLLFAKTLGGTELVTLLRQLGDFTRQDLALRHEIEAKQSWIRNSAHLSSAAPWLLLLLLSTQPSTAATYATSAGITVLFIGVMMTLTAYLWMGRLARLPEPPRIFGHQ